MIAKEAKYINYIKSSFPQIEISKIEYNFVDGKHNDIVIVNDQNAFKFSKYDWSVDFLENEIAVINLIRSHVSMPLPKVEPLEKGMAKFSYIKGDPLYRNDLLLLDNRIQENIAEQIGTFLRQLHMIPLKGEGHKNISECPAVLSREDWLLKYDELQKKVFPYCDSYSIEYFRQNFKPLLKNEKFLNFQPSLIHGDLMPYHFIFNKGTNKINGVIDFGLSGIGDPAYDVGIILDNFGEAFVKRIGKYYRNISTFINRARFYAYTNNLCWAKDVSDMLATRDFTNFRIHAKERDIMPIGSKW